MKTKLNGKHARSGVGFLAFFGLVIVAGLVIWGVPLVIWYFRTIDGTPLPLPGKPKVEQGGFVPLDVNGNEPARCHCGGACLEE